MNLEILSIPYDFNYDDVIISSKLCWHSLITCQYCHRELCVNYIPSSIKFANCIKCHSSIINEQKKIISSMCYKRKLWQTILPQIYEEIRNIGMHPIRIWQTQLFDTTLWKQLHQDKSHL